jgi:hypothetical protein
VAQEDAPTTELLTGVVGDRCPNCQTPMAADQRYCLNCGERRGRARFSPATFAPQATPVTEEVAVSRRHRPRFSSGATLVAGVATLLIAMGVGVLIGHDSNTTAPAKTPIINVGGGGSAATTPASNTPTTGQVAATGKAPKGKVAKATVVHVTANTARAATAAASKVLGSSKNLSNNVQQSIGGSCSGGAGCQNGKFTGNFFPGG